MLSGKLTQPLTRLVEAEPLGSELMNDPFLTDVTKWTVLSAGSKSIETSTPPTGFMQYMRLTSGDGTYDRLEPATGRVYEVGKTYRVQALVRGNSSSESNSGFFSFSFTNGAEDVKISGTHWQLLSVDVVANTTFGLPRLYINQTSGSTSDYIDCAMLSVKEIL